MRTDLEPKMKYRFLPLVLLAGVALLGIPACSTNTQGDDASPVFLVVNFDQLPAGKNVADGTPLQIDTATVRSVLKNPTADSTQFLDTKVDDYVVSWQRLDGGTAVPKPEVFGGNFVVGAGGTSNLTNYIFMTAGALQEPPLNQLFPFNGGLDRETGKSEIRCRAIVTFRGHTLGGQPVTGSGNFGMIFYYATPGAVRGGK